MTGASGHVKTRLRLKVTGSRGSSWLDAVSARQSPVQTGLRSERLLGQGI